MNHARGLGLRVIVDLVVNHTSDEHRWFQEARRDRNAPTRDWYVWADERPADHAQGVVFPGVQKTTWTYDEVAKQYYFHRFYDFQPDLNTLHASVRDRFAKATSSPRCRRNCRLAPTARSSPSRCSGLRTPKALSL